MGLQLWKKATDLLDTGKERREKHSGYRKHTDVFFPRKVKSQREKDAEAVIRLLRHHRFVSIYGAKGVGKSHFLKRELCNQLEDNNFFPLLIRLPSLRFKISKLEHYSLTYALHDAAVNSLKMSDLPHHPVSVQQDHEIQPPASSKSYVESVVSAVDYLQNPAQGFSKFCSDVGITASVRPVVIIDEVEEIFREENNPVDHASEVTGDVSEKWLHTFHEISDVAEQRLDIDVDLFRDDKLKFRQSVPQLVSYSTILCFEEDSIAFVRQLSVALPSVMRSMYRLRGFTHESAIKILCESEDLEYSSGSSYAKAALILNYLTSTSLLDRRQLALDRIVGASTARLLSTDGKIRKSPERTVTASEISLARLMLEWQARKSTKYAPTHNQSFNRFKLFCLSSLAGARKHLGIGRRGRWFGKIIWKLKQRSSQTPKNSYSERVSAVPSPNGSRRFMELFSECLLGQVNSEKVGAIVKLFSDSNGYPCSVPISKARIVLSRRKFWFLFSKKHHYSMNLKQFEADLEKNPLFLLKDSSSGRNVTVTNPLVLRTLEYNYRQQRKRRLLWQCVVGAIISLLVLYFTFSTVKRNDALVNQREWFSESNWEELFDLNAELIVLGDPQADIEGQQAWLTWRKEALSQWMGEGFDNTRDLDEIASAQLQIYRSSTAQDAFAEYMALKDKLMKFILDPIACGERCVSFVQNSLHDSFKYLLLSLSIIDPKFRSLDSTLSDLQINVLTSEISQFCRWGFENTAINIVNVPTNSKISPARCAALYVPPRS